MTFEMIVQCDQTVALKGRKHYHFFLYKFTVQEKLSFNLMVYTAGNDQFFIVQEKLTNRHSSYFQ